LNKDSQCLKGNLFKTTNTSSISKGTLTYNWNFGDGSALVTGNTASHVYGNSGTYKISMYSTTDFACLDTLNKLVGVWPKTKPAFSYFGDTTQCLGQNQFKFKDSSSVSSGSIIKNQWRFGDGDTALGKTTSHIYKTSGTFNVYLITTSNNYCKDTTIRKVKLLPKSVISFSLPLLNDSQCLKGNSFKFTNNSSIIAGSSITGYTWDFGDATSRSTSANTTHTYAASGVYTVALMTTNSAGCKDTLNKIIWVWPQASTNFTIAKDSQCLKANSFQFTNTSSISSGSIKRNKWKFSTISSDTLIKLDATKKYNSEGKYTVVLSTTTNKGCKDTAIKQVIVHPQTQIGYSLNADSQCLKGNNFKFTNSSLIVTGSIANYNWDLGNSTNSTVASPTVSYTSKGTYYVRLITTTNYGCLDTLKKPVGVWPQSTLSFTTNKDSQCLKGNSFQFTNGSTITPGSISTYKWEFGDATTATTKDAAKKYANEGTYNVKLATVSNRGCKDTLLKMVVVNPQTKIAFTLNADSQCLKGNNFNITNTSSIVSGSIVKYNWDLGNATTSTVASPTISYASKGTYKLRVITTTNYGCLDTLTKPVGVWPQSTLSYSIDKDSQCLKGNSFQFTNASTIAPGSISTYKWEFDDGTTSAAKDATKKYANAGNYNVKMSTFSNRGCMDTLIKKVVVMPQMTISFTTNSDTQCNSLNKYIFTSKSSIASGSIVSYKWDFGDASANVSTQNATYSYVSSGSYSVKFMTTSNFGCKDTFIKQVKVLPKANLSFSLPLLNDSQCLKGNSFKFTNNSTIVAGASISGYVWDFGDATTRSTSANTTHTYSNAGTYTVTLMSTNSAGCRDTLTKIIWVWPQASASFTIAKDSQCLKGNNFQFTNTSTISTGTIKRNKWKFSTVASDTLIQLNASKKYTTEGNYLVYLYTKTNKGCNDTAFKQVVVNPQTVISFTLNADSQCLKGNNFKITNLSKIVSGSIAKYNWDLGNTTTSTVASPSVIYASKGTYKIRIITTTNYGCLDTLTKPVGVWPQTNPNFTIAKDSQCLKANNFQFTNTSSISPGSIASYKWEFGDATTATTKDASKKYASEGNYTVQMSTVSNQGCKDTIVKKVVVNPQTKIAFTLNSDSQCLKGNNFKITNTSSIVTGSIVKYNWDFGNTTTSTSVSPSVSYASKGTYKIRVITATNYGCLDTLTKPVGVWPQANPLFTISKDSQCLKGNNFQFTNGSTISPGSITTYKWEFGDATTAATKDASKKYASEGTYSVKMSTVSNQGCKDTIIKKVVVNPQTKIAFTLNADSQCLKGNSFKITNTSSIVSGSIVKYNWDLGNATNSTIASPSVSYASKGIYNLRVITTSNFGCLDTLIKSVGVWPQANPLFTIAKDSQCLRSNNFQFTNGSTISPGSISTYKWEFGDATTAATKDASKKYSTDGIFTVKMSTISNRGCKDTFSKKVFVNPQANLKYSLNADSQCFKGNNFKITNTSSISYGSIVKYTWDFGNSVNSNLSAPSVSYSSVGTYKVQLFSITNLGCLDTLIKSVGVWPQSKPSFTVPNDTQCLSGNKFIFTNKSSIIGGIISKNLWNFGDKTKDSLTNPTHSYKYDSAFKVELVTVTNRGCRDSFYKVVTIRPQAKISYKFNIDSQCLKGNFYKVLNFTTIKNATIISHSWDFGNNVFSNLYAPGVSYGQAGTYKIVYSTISNHGCFDTNIRNVSVFPQSNLSFKTNKDTQCLRGNTFQILNNSSIVSGKIANYAWYWGDGNLTSGINATPKYNYGYDGIFTLKLVSKTDHNCLDTLTRRIIVNPQGNPDFKIDDDIQCEKNNLFIFTNISKSTNAIIKKYNWIFGDGNTALGTNANHSYAITGSFNVNLISVTDQNCYDTIARPVSISPTPKVIATVNKAAMCLNGNSFKFTSSSTATPDNIKTERWSFGDSKNQNGTIANHIYSQYGLYKVKLYVESVEGCSDSTYLNVQVHPQSIVNINPDTTFDCLKGNFIEYFTQSRVNGPGSIANYLWNFGDGSSSVSKFTNHKYAYNSLFNVKLSVTTDQGCVDSATALINVYPQTLVDYAINADTQCLTNNLFTFTNNSTISYPTKSVFYKWKISDGYQGFSPSINRSFLTEGSYKIDLMTNTNFGCKDTVSKFIFVAPMPEASFIVDDPNQCQNIGVFNFTNYSKVSIGGLKYNWNFGDGNTSAVINPSIKFANPGAYITRLIAISDFGCTDTFYGKLSAVESPTVDLPNFRLACEYDTVSLVPYIKGYKPLIYSWNGPNGFTDATPRLFFNTSFKSIQGKYVIKVTDSTGCWALDSADIIVLNRPVVNASIKSPVCSGKDVYLYSNGASKYNWTGPLSFTSTQQNPIIIKAQQQNSGVYTVIGTDNNGCKDTAIVRARVSLSPTANFYFSNEAKGVENSPVFATDASRGADSIWFYDYYFDTLISTQRQFSKIYKDSGMYGVYQIVKDKLGCTDSILKYVRIYPQPFIFVPNAFTPNTDFHNNYFYPSTVNFVYYKMIIMNRWGDIVYEGENGSWDGKHNGEFVWGGVYAAYIRALDILGEWHTIKTDVTVLR
jgi:PKD repeat protein